MNATTYSPTLAGADTLLLGWGNPGRCDDGLGPALISAVEARNPPGARFDSDYQLQVENAAEVARYERVVFVDADRAGCAPFSLRRVYPDARSMSFSTHSVRPEAVLALARDLFGAEPEAWLLGIQGYEFDSFGEGLSPGARANLAAATEFVEESLRRRDFRSVRSTDGERSPAPTGSTHEPECEDDPCQTTSP